MRSRFEQSKLGPFDLDPKGRETHFRSLFFYSGPATTSPPTPDLQNVTELSGAAFAAAPVMD